MAIKFYDTQTAPSPRRARIILAEKKVPHESIEIDMLRSEQMSDAYRLINPNCTIPALQLEDGTVLTDNAGIVAFLEETYPEPPLLGSTAIEKAEIATWQSKIEMEFAIPVASAFRNSHPAMKGRALTGAENYQQIPALAERGLVQIDVFLNKLESHLEGREFIATNRLSVADITAACMLDFARVVGKKLSAKQTNLMRWRAELGARPSFNL